MSPQIKRSITAEDLYRIELISEPRIAPDGKHVVYTQQRVEKKTEKKYTNLWVVPTDGGLPKQFTYGDQSDSSPRWSPDGKQIAFLSNRGDKDKPAQIYLIPFDGGEARPLTEIEGETQLVGWSPDGRKLLCLVRKLDAEELEREKDEQKKKLGVVSRQYSRLFYKLDGYGYLSAHERTHIWLVDARTGKGKQLTEGDSTEESYPTFSPDGSLIAFISNHAKDPDQAIDRQDIFVMSAQGGAEAEAPKRIKTPIGPKHHPSFSPDGKWIAYLGHEGEGVDYRNNNVWIVPADGSKAPKNLTAQYDLLCEVSIIGDSGAPEQMAPTWSPDGKFITFQASLHGSVALKRISVDGSNLTDVVGEGGSVGSPSFDKSHSRVSYLFGQMHDPGQIHLKELTDSPSTGSGFTTRHLTRVNRALFESLELSKVEEVWFKGADDNDLQGWIMFPPGFDPKKKYPSILEIHGGPLTQYGKTFMHEFYFLAAQGYVVYFCNPRGGHGYGEKHAGGIWGAWGSVDYSDVMAWADLMVEKPYIDPKRMGVTGGSYGGYMTLWIIGHTERFKAAVAQRVVSNMVSEWGSSDFNWTFEYELEAEPPYKDIQKWWDMSPMKYIGNAKTPTMITHSENDLRCPIEQGEQAFVALKHLGVDTELIRFPDEFHGLSRTGRTDRRIARLGHIARWMEKYLK